MNFITFLLIIVLNTSILASDACKTNEIVKSIASNYNIDLRTKSTKGWIRLFRNEEKCRKYKMNKKDRKYLIACLLKYYRNRPKIGRIS